LSEIYFPANLDYFANLLHLTFTQPDAMVSNQFVALKIAICLLNIQDINHAAVNAMSLLLKDVILRLSSQLTDEMSNACHELLSLAFCVSEQVLFY
jgi:hypothetical protein